MVSAAKVARVLDGVNFPANKKNIIDYAKNNDAPQDVLFVLQQITEGTYYSIAGVLEAVMQAA